jgi:hypothetical protein
MQWLTGLKTNNSPRQRNFLIDFSACGRLDRIAGSASAVGKEQLYCFLKGGNDVQHMRLQIGQENKSQGHQKQNETEIKKEIAFAARPTI